MKSIQKLIHDYPLGAIALLLLACVKFEYRGDQWSYSAPGLGAGFLILVIIGIVLLLRIRNAAQEACLARGIDPSNVRSKYDILIPIGIVASLAHFNWVGPTIEDGGGKFHYLWEFEWSDWQWNLAFIGALVAVVLLIRVLYLLRAIGDTSARAGSASNLAS